MSSKSHMLVAGLVLAFAQGSQAQGGVFTVNCAPLTVFRGDPIVSPGALSSHVHAVVGGTAFQLSLSNEQARNSKATTCDKVLDNSNYWQPQLYHQRRDGKFEVVEMEGIAAYYIDRACDYAKGRTNCNGAPGAIAPPMGLRMLVGDPKLRTFDKANPEQRAMQHVCLMDRAADETNTYSLPTKQCKRMRAETFFQSCWDGKNLDSPNHKSHVAFPAIGDYNTGVCPESHPRAILSVFYEFFYNTAAIKDFNRFVWAMGDATGYGLHGDFLNGWSDQHALDRAISTCTGPQGINDSGCSLNVGPNGPGQAARHPLEVAAPKEDVGLNGSLGKLPGDNPVTG